MKRLLVGFLTILMAVSLAAGCGNDKTPEEKDKLVKSEVVKLGDSIENGEYSGVVRGRYETNMAFQVGGQIIQRNVQMGDTVKAGQVLMVIDPRDVVQKAQQGDAQVAAAEAQLTLARSNLSRYQELYRQEAVPASVLDQYQSAYDAAVASYNQASAIASQGHNAMGYTSLTASSDGVISSVTGESGQVVAAGQTVLTLVQSGELEIEINVPESHLTDVSLGQEVELSFWALANTTAKGIVREIAPMADSVARTYKVRVTVVNPPADMKLGMTATVKIPGVTPAAGGSSNYAVLPLSAIYQQGDDAQVWLVNQDDHTIYLKNVKVENFSNNKARVEGLANGDIVITAGVHKLREGMKVRLSEDES